MSHSGAGPADFSPAKRALLQALLAREGVAAPAPRQIQCRQGTGPVPLSFSQQRLWFLDQLEPGRAVYNLSGAVHLHGLLDLRALQQSLNEVVRRHEMLRTTFLLRDDGPVQLVAPSLEIALPIRDLRDLPEESREAAAVKLASDEAKRPFDLARGPLLRALLLITGAEDSLLVLTMHHIVSDGWSQGVMIRELSTLYGSFAAGKPSPLPELPVQYADFALWQRQWLQGDTLEKQTAYWRQCLADMPSVLDLPADFPRPPVQSFRGATHAFTLPPSLLTDLLALARQEGCTLHMVLLAGLQALLSRYSGRTDIPVGTPVANRPRPELESLIGVFINTLVMRTDLTGNPTFRELLARVREVAMGAYAHQDLPFEMLVDALRPERNLNYTPLFQVMLILQNGPAAAIQLPGLELREVKLEATTAKFDLTLNLYEEDSHLSGVVEYNTDLFSAETVARLIRHLATLLEAGASRPDLRLAQLPLLAPAERDQILVGWNQTAADFPRDRCLHQLFEEQAARTPDAVAIEAGNERLTFSELNRRANRLARLLRQRGLGPDKLAGVCMERSLAMVVGLLGILKAGGAYVPLDPAYPESRRSFILSDTHVQVLLTQRNLTGSMALEGVDAIFLDDDWAALAPEDGTNLPSVATPDSLAYVMYTSGSTGRPKGVAIEHRSVVAFLDWCRTVYPPEDLAGVLATTSICFDISVFELFTPLCWGGKVILAANSLQLQAMAHRDDITLINMVPSAVAELLRTGSIPASVRTVNLAGEATPESLPPEVYRLTHALRVLDVYGPTEDTVYSTWALLGRTGKITVGRPITNTQAYVLDSAFEPVPVGVPGELYLSGSGQARGYLGRPDLTAERFLPNPFIPGARMYRTGDLARYWPDGTIEYLGRIDHMLKLRGFRIEPGEIEAALREHPAVQDAVVAMQENLPDDRRLIAYVVGQAGSAPPPWPELREYLKERLPEYMVPSHCVVLAELPRTPNGKLDRGALKAIPATGTARSSDHVAPTSPLQRRIAAIWQEVLGVERVGLTDNFFEQGGHSLLLAQVHARLQQDLGRDLSLIDLFRYPSVGALAAYLSREGEPTGYSEASHRGANRREALIRRHGARLPERTMPTDRGSSGEGGTGHGQP